MGRDHIGGGGRSQHVAVRVQDVDAFINDVAFQGLCSRLGVDFWYPVFGNSAGCTQYVDLRRDCVDFDYPPPRFISETCCSPLELIAPMGIVGGLT